MARGWMNPPDQCSSPDARRSRRGGSLPSDHRARERRRTGHADRGCKGEGWNGREGDREGNSRVNTCVHTRLRGNARCVRTAPSAYCSVPTCLRPAASTPRRNHEGSYGAIGVSLRSKENEGRAVFACNTYAPSRDASRGGPTSRSSCISSPLP